MRATAVNKLDMDNDRQRLLLDDTNDVTSHSGDDDNDIEYVDDVHVTDDDVTAVFNAIQNDSTVWDQDPDMLVSAANGYVRATDVSTDRVTNSNTNEQNAPRNSANNHQATVQNHTTPTAVTSADPVYKCCFHIDRHPQLDTAVLVLNVILVAVCFGHGVLVWLENVRAHGWCVLDTSFQAGDGNDTVIIKWSIEGALDVSTVEALFSLLCDKITCAN